MTPKMYFINGFGSFKCFFRYRHRTVPWHSPEWVVNVMSGLLHFVHCECKELSQSDIFLHYVDWVHHCHHCWPSPDQALLVSLVFFHQVRWIHPNILNQYMLCNLIIALPSLWCNTSTLFQFIPSSHSQLYLQMNSANIISVSQCQYVIYPW